eukprot:4922813-Lingulodinium_polyedra.AAC.1
MPQRPIAHPIAQRAFDAPRDGACKSTLRRHARAREKHTRAPCFGAARCLRLLFECRLIAAACC